MTISNYVIAWLATAAAIHQLVLVLKFLSPILLLVSKPPLLIMLLVQVLVLRLLSLILLLMKLPLLFLPYSTSLMPHVVISITH